MTWRINEAALSESFLAATGPGGQNVNKVATAVQLHVDVAALGLPEDARQRFVKSAGKRVNNDGQLVLIVRKHRSQETNRAEARERLSAMIEAALRPPPKRAKTRLNRVGKVKRLAAKKNRSVIKQGRGKVRPE